MVVYGMNGQIFMKSTERISSFWFGSTFKSPVDEINTHPALDAVSCYLASQRFTRKETLIQHKNQQDPEGPCWLYK